MPIKVRYTALPYIKITEIKIYPNICHMPRMIVDEDRDVDQESITRWIDLVM